MTDIDDFARVMQSESPGLKVQVRHAGATLRWVDVRLDGHFSALSWDSDQGFGFYDESEDNPGYGHEVPLRTIKNPREAARHQLAVLRALGWPLRGPVAVGSR